MEHCGSLAESAEHYGSLAESSEHYGSLAEGAEHHGLEYETLPVQDLIQYPSLKLKEFVETWHRVGVTLSYHSKYDEVRKRLNLAVTTIMGAREGKPCDRGEWLGLLSG